MALMDFIKKQFIDILQWTEDADGTLAWRFPMQEMEIQNGASLTVRDSQLALFVNEGTVADVFGPGMYKLTTQTLPVLTYLKNWDKLFESPFKSDLYFFSTRHQLDQKWGTPNPITIRDKEFGIVRMRAFGIYSYHLSDAKTFYQKISGTRDSYGREELEGQLRNSMVAGLTDLFGESGVSFVDMAGNQDEFGAAMLFKMKPLFAEYGLILDSLVVQNVSLPEELQKILDQKIGMNMIGDMGRYTQYQVANAIPEAAKNEGGMAGMGVGLGAGVGFGQVMGQAMAAAIPSVPAAAPGVASVSADEVVATLEKLHGLVEKGILTKEEFEAKKVELLKKLT
ncbi:SPFH domain-containing protein [Dechloromonas denitrificans]|uniref:SPFH domain-containing protein n=1 Tax=Dechloromonas denitrificans TaxID=281362 RepID=UPI001CF829A6|nr:SPFH domain-containing protein [Dechloromonas denitrificans]UCV04162.1 SPFH domain-containing protein [Dechloromonas denitrificans]UCV08432.1 SPFH domain-containing protein [Dechloromonas denitrificans]